MLISLPLEKEIGLDSHRLPALSIIKAMSAKTLALPDSEHLGAAYWAGSLGRRFAILHGDCLSILNLSLGSALDAISLHVHPSSLAALL